MTEQVCTMVRMRFAPVVVGDDLPRGLCLFGTCDGSGARPRSKSLDLMNSALRCSLRPQSDGIGTSANLFGYTADHFQIALTEITVSGGIECSEGKSGESQGRVSAGIQRVCFGIVRIVSDYLAGILAQSRRLVSSFYPSISGKELEIEQSVGKIF